MVLVCFEGGGVMVVIVLIDKRFEMCFRGKKGTREGNKLGQCEGRVEKQKERIRQRAVMG